MMNLWWIVIGMGIVTFGIRLVPIVLLGRIEIPIPVQRALRFVPPAVLTAIIVPELLYRNNQLDASPENVRLLAGLTSFISKRCFSHFFSRGPDGMLARSSM